jgi:2-epi-valiolone-7-phosphate 1-reductase
MITLLTGRHEALVRHNGVLHFTQIPTAVPGSGGLLIAPSFVGVCGTDLQILNGTRPDTAEILGHEGVGVVVHASPGASMRVGEHVVFNPAAQSSTGRILGHNTPGLFQRYVAVDLQAVEDGLVLPVRDHLPPVCGALVEPLGAVVYAYDLISRRASPLDSVAVFGAGPIGLLMAAYLTFRGTRAVLIHPQKARLDTARALGFAPAVFEADEHFDAAVICTTRQGAPAALQQAVKMVKSDGCVDLITNYPEDAPAPEGIATDGLRAVRAANICGLPQDGAYLFAKVGNRRMAFTGHRGTSADHLFRAMAELRSHESLYRRLVTHILPLKDAAQAIQTLACSNERSLHGHDCIKAVIDMTGDPCLTGQQSS